MHLLQRSSALDNIYCGNKSYNNTLALLSLFVSPGNSQSNVVLFR